MQTDQSELHKYQLATGLCSCVRRGRTQRNTQACVTGSVLGGTVSSKSKV